MNNEQERDVIFYVYAEDLKSFQVKMNSFCIGNKKIKNLYVDYGPKNYLKNKPNLLRALKENKDVDIYIRHDDVEELTSDLRELSKIIKECKNNNIKIYSLDGSNVSLKMEAFHNIAKSIDETEIKRRKRQLELSRRHKKKSEMKKAKEEENER